MKNHDSKNLLVSIIKRNTIVAVTLVFVFVASGMTVASRHNANEDLYVPSILLIKTGVARDATGADNILFGIDVYIDCHLLKLGFQRYDTLHLIRILHQLTYKNRQLTT